MKKLFFLLGLLLLSLQMQAEDSSKAWTLTSCIEYALENNIDIRKSRLNLESAELSTQYARAQLYPNLSANISQGFTNNAFVKGSSAYTGSYGLSASMNLYRGGINWNNIRQQQLYEQSGAYNLEAAELDLKMSLFQVYMQLLYSAEAVDLYESMVAMSEYQCDRGERMLEAGSISKADYAQLESQLASDKYQLVMANNSLRTMKMELRQLLEITGFDDFNVATPEVDEVLVLRPLDDFQSIYYVALNSLPDIKACRADSMATAYELKKARGGYFPTITLNADVATGHNTASDYSFGDQLKYGLNEGVGLTISIPILTNRENKNAVEQAKIEQRNAVLTIADTEKTLRTELETLYNNAVAAQSQYIAAKEQLKSLEISLELIEQQYELGLKNTLELLTEKNNYLQAQQNLLEAKYDGVINVELLNLYQGKDLEIK
ncbi:MAG: TolC family protein [Bacteroidetes bacterium]|uniref:TolC family protein n=1 Tax=Candidatus Gallipaludibacter merdavium TaxID=2840839 RepID=A0A9D9HVA0_9BACT|nr:TolC family protein [Candidatus Gallipaludibacter merdavium]